MLQRTTAKLPRMPAIGHGQTDNGHNTSCQLIASKALSLQRSVL